MLTNLLNIGIITQARMTSTRLPGKILKKANGKFLLQYHIDRLQQTGLGVIIATTTNATDDCIDEFARVNHLKCYRGSESNVLSRYYEAAKLYNLNTIVRVTSDCPLIDGNLIRSNVDKYVQLNNQNAYMGNSIERTFARGFDFEIFSFKLLEDAYHNAVDETDLEHVTPYIWKNRSGKVEFTYIKQPVDNSNLRITVDNADDFELVKALIEKYNADQLSFSEIENTLIQHPELVAINGHVEQKKV